MKTLSSYFCISVLIALFQFPVIIFAQSDNCATATTLDLSSGNTCFSGTNANATSTNTFYGTCNVSPNVVNEVWFTFVATGPNNTFVITPGTLTNAELILYSGGCAGTPGNVLENCATANANGTLTFTWNFNIGQQIWIGVGSNGGVNGTFDLCVTSAPPAAVSGNTCALAIPICNKNPFAFTNMTGLGASGQTPNCFANPTQTDMFLQFTPVQTGTIEWTAMPTAGTEFDWAMFDITTGCPGNTIACNYNFAGGSVNGFGMSVNTIICPVTSITNDPTQEFCQPITVTAGNTYLIQISNFDNDGAGFNITWGGTAVLTPVSNFTVTPSTFVCGSSVTAVITDNSVGTPTYDFGDGSATYTGNSPPNHNYTTPGTYAITANITGACPSTHTEFVQLYGPVSITSSKTDETCFGDCNGTASASIISGGSGIFTFNWNTGATTNSISGLCAGNYDLSVTDATCATTTVANITVQAGGSVSVTNNCTDVTAIGLNDGTSTATASGGTGIYTYSWSPAPATGQTTPAVNNLPGGSYTVNVIDSKGCTATNTCTVNSSACTVSPSTTVTDILCNGTTNGQISAEMVGTTGTSLTYKWDAATGNQSTPIAIGLSGGTYSVTITDELGCQIVTSSTINEPTALNVTLSKINPLCNGGSNGSATAVINGGIPTYNYNWNDNLNQSTATASGIGADTLTVIVTDANNCTVTSTIKILEPIAISVSTTTTNSSCGEANGGANVNANGGSGSFTFLWSDPNASTLSSLINVIAGAYTVTVTDANSCTATASAVISDISGMTAHLTDSINVSCFGGSNGQATVEMLNGTGNTPLFNWSNSVTTPTAFNLTAGTYTVEITDSIGCKSSTSVTILEPTQLISNPSFTNPLCFGEANGTAQTIVSGGTAPYNFVWNNPSGITTNNATNLTSGNYSLDVTDANGCIISESFTLVDPPLLNATIASTNINCFGANNGTASLTMVSGSSPYFYNWSNTPQASANINNLNANTYNVTITDNINCTITRSTTITEPTQLNVSVTNFSNVSCQGLADGFVQITVTGGVLPYSFNWSNNATSQDLNNVGANTYTATVTDANNCSTTISQLIIEPQTLTASITGQNVSCYNLCNGTASVIPSGGSLPYSIQWGANAAFQTTNIATNICAGSINVTITDANNCSINENIIISQPAKLIATIDTSSSNCGQNNGRITVIATLGGTLPYTYQWNDPNLTQSPVLGNITAGCYRVIINDANNCTIDSIICINDIEGPKVTLFNSTDVTCFNDCDGQINLTVVTPISSNFPPSIDWTSNCNNTSTPLPLFKDGLAAFLLCNCDYSVIVTDTAGCIGSFTHTIVQPKAILSLIANPTNVSCFGGSDGVAPGFAVLGTPPYTYQWIPNGQTTITATGLVPGNHCLVTTDTKGCDDTTCVVITEPIELKITPTIRNVTCNNTCDGSISLTVSGGKPGYNYFWSNTLPNQATVGNLCAGIYTVTVFDANGCSSIISSTVSEPLPLIASISSLPSFCGKPNGSASVSASTGGTPPYLYQWNTQPPQTTFTASNLLMGNYTAIVSDQNGCTLSLFTTVTDQPGPIITNISTTNPNCAGQATGSAQVSFTNGTPSFLFSWDDLLIQPNQTANNLTAGIYHVTVSDANGCIDVGTAIIQQPNPLIAIPIGSKTICYGDSTTIWGAAQGGTPFTSGTSYNITWVDSTQWNGNQGPHVVNPLVSTDFNYTIKDSKGCSASAGITVIVGPPLQISVPTEETICLGSSAALSATGFGGAATSNWCFHWTGGDIAGLNAEVTDCGMNTDNQTVNPVDTTTYRVILTDACSFSDTAFITVNVLPLPVPVFVPVKPEGCPPFEAIFSGNSNMDTVNICWDFDADGINDTCEIVDNAGDHSIQKWTYNSSGFHDIILSVESQDGCNFSKPFLQAVHVLPAPTAAFTAAPKVVNLINSLVSFNASETLNANDISWDFGNGNGGSNIFEQNQYESVDTFFVKLTAFNNFGCLDTARDTIVVQPDHAMYTPNAFTPNNDGKNDYFFPDGIGISDLNYQLTIFDRWGELIFKSNNRQVQWNGSVKNSNTTAPTGVYIWRIQAVDLNGKTIENTRRVGQVTLLR